MLPMTSKKTIFLIRHAKTESPLPGMDDFDRVLKKRGENDAAEISARLVARGAKPDLILSSPAKRAKKTAEIFAAALKPEKGILFIPELYLPHPSVFDAILSKLDSSITSVAIVSHNNGITEYANSLGIVRIDNMPTASVLGYEDGIKRKFLFFEFPNKKND